MRSLAQELAISEQRARPVRSPDAALPIREFVGFPTPRRINEWVNAGQVVAGHEVNGLALPDRVVETLGLPDPAEYVVIGEERYSDGRWYLAFAVTEAWVSAQRPPCADCGGTSGRHERVDFEDPKTGKTRRVMCPSAPPRRRS